MSLVRSKRFRWRAFVSFGLLFSFLAAVAAGVILYLRPEGSLASWVRWDVLGVDKKGWEGVHTLFVIPLLVFAVGHLALNAGALFRYAGAKASEGLRAKAECGLALGISALLFAAAVNHWPPFGKVIELRSAIKAGRYSVATPPPVADAENLTLSEWGGLIGISEETALSRLRAAGIAAAGGRTTLAEIADQHGTSPEKLYEIISVPGRDEPVR